MAFDWSLDADAVEPTAPAPLPTRRSLREAAAASSAPRVVRASRPVPEPAMAQESVTVETVPDTVSTATDILAVLTAPATEPVAAAPAAVEPAASVATEQPMSRRAARMAAMNSSLPAVPRPSEKVIPLVTEPAQQSAAPASSRRAQTSVRPPRAVARPATRASDRSAKRPSLRRIVPKIISVSAAFGALGLLVATSLPANAFMTTSADIAPTSVTTTASVQKMAAIDAKTVAAEAPTRDNYTVQTSTDRFRTSNSTDWSYTNDPNGTIQWPFPVQVPIATGFGPRHVAGCGFCSTFHLGVDFDPGLGAPVGAIADGVVTEVDLQPSSPLGNHVTIEHTINGQKIESVYGHMITGSVRVVVGQAVKVTDIVGETGSTGNSTGAHLHLEVHVNGVPVDPFAWLKANAN